MVSFWTRLKFCHLVQGQMRSEGHEHTEYFMILFLTHQQRTPFENIVGIEEIARNEQFLLFPQCFVLN